MDMGGEEGGVCIGPAIEEIASGFPPPQWPRARPGLKIGKKLDR